MSRRPRPLGAGGMNQRNGAGVRGVILVAGAVGMVDLVAASGDRLALKRGELPQGPDWGKEPAEAWGTLSLVEGDKVTERAVPTEPGDYRDYYANVRDAILVKVPLAVTPQGALSVMRVLELARQSSDERRVVPYA